ncbi:MAG: inosine/xanthosine triphosphatase [Deltaproteobacteria bacterium]|nr:inosine/xanthosine triphosphatase [Deltaproteobacteria bacterium]
MKIVLASTNPVKARAALNGFRNLFPDQDFDLVQAPADSGVADQPFSDVETYRGARNRACNVAKAFPEADFWVGIEGGVEEVGLDLAAFAWIVVQNRERSGRARTSTFFLPPAVSHLVRGGKELGEADDEIFGQTNSKQKAGAVGLLTAGVLDRATLYEPAVTLALIPFLNHQLYPAREAQTADSPSAETRS